MADGREARDHLALALDLDDLVAALRVAKLVSPWFGVAKIGLELYSAAGPDAVSALSDAGFSVFVDLKLHDIPTTVERAATVLGALGVRYTTLHAHGGPVMLRAGVEGLKHGAAAAGLPAPTALAVTVLTSDADAPDHILGKRVQAAIEGGCGGLVCAAARVAEAKQLAPKMVIVVPGIRPEGVAAHDQALPSTPQAARAAGADLLVVGRAVTQADDPAKAAQAIAESIA
jgi:orotidine-5'-phosphate decarboxylase